VIQVVSPEERPAMYCPADCHECHEPLCTRACELTGEPPLTTCADCGALGVSVTRIYICGDCLSGEETDRTPPSGTV